MQTHETTRTDLRSAKAVTQDLGISDTTLWRWRQNGWIEVVNVNGRPFVVVSSLARFQDRAAAGEFAKHAPRKAGNQKGGRDE